MELNAVGVFTAIAMEIDTRETGQITKNMEKGPTIIGMELNTRVNIKLIRSTEEGCFIRHRETRCKVLSKIMRLLKNNFLKIFLF